MARISSDYDQQAQPGKSASAPNPGISLAGAVDLSSLKHATDAAPGEKGGAPAAGKYVIDVTQATLKAVVQTSATYPVLVLLWIKSDDRFFALARTLGDAINGMDGKMQLARIDVADFPGAAEVFGARGVPAMFALIAGRPVPVFEGLPEPAQLQEITESVLPQVVQLAAQAGISGTAPIADSDGSDNGDDSADSVQENIPPEHQAAHDLAASGDYAGAAAEYARLLEANPSDTLAARERAKSLLLARCQSMDIAAVRTEGAEKPDDLEAQLAVADADMRDGHVDDAFSRLLDFAAAHHEALDAVRKRLLSYFDICGSSDERVSRARRRIATLMY